MSNPQIDAPAHYIPLTAISFADSDGSAVPASRDAPLPVSGTVSISASAPVATVPATMAARAWPVGTTLDATGYALVRIQVDGIGGGDSLAIAGSLGAGGTTYPWRANDQGGNAFLGITTPGIYTMAGRGFLTATVTGTASSPVITASASA